MKTLKYNSYHPQLNVLSNFFNSPFVAKYRGELVMFRTAEHYFHAHKTKDREQAAKILTSPDASKARYFGSAKGGCTIPNNWDSELRKKVMFKALHYKFAQNPLLLEILLSTEGKKLAEDSPWDEYFGLGKEGKGANVAGKMLTKLRDAYLEDNTYLDKYKIDAILKGKRLLYKNIAVFERSDKRGN